MASATQTFIDTLRAQRTEIAEAIVGDLMANAFSYSQNASRDELIGSVGATLDAWADSLAQGDFAPLRAHMQRIAELRASSKIEFGEVLGVVQSLRTEFWLLIEQIFREQPSDLSLVKRIEAELHETTRIITSAYNEVMREAKTLLADREQALAYQGRLIQELSTPIVPVYEGVLVLPLSGAVDSRRASQIMEAALEQIVGNQADVLILDITGVPVVDTGVANYLIQMARAVNLLGAQVVLVGIGAEVAQTIVQLGVELQNIVTRSNLQAGIEYALRLRGHAIQQL